jgi:hypothetical protein
MLVIHLVNVIFVFNFSVDMADTNQEEKPTTIDGSKQQSVQETSDQSDDTTSKTKTIPGRRPNSIVSEYPLPETE